MTTLNHLFQSLLPALPVQPDRETSYLAAATDIADLERRMRALEHGDGAGSQLPLGLGLR